LFIGTFPLFGITVPFREEPKGIVAALPFALGVGVPGAELTGTPAPIEPSVLGALAAPPPLSTPPAALHRATTPTTNIEVTMIVFIVASC